MKKSLKKLSSINIKRTKELALRLGVPLDILLTILNNIERHSWSFQKMIGKKERTLHNVSAELKGILEKLDTEILDRFDYPENFQGGIKGRSLRSNALPHSGKRNVGNFDIKSFFPSITPSHIYKTFTKLGCVPDVARVITRLVTADGCLPQGFLTSPKVAALVLLNMNKRLTGLLSKHGLQHTIWIDDLTVSGSFPIKKLKPSIRKIGNQEGFIVHKDEDTPTYHNKRQLVTGAVVNTIPSVPKEKLKAIRKTVYSCEKTGIRQHWREYIKPHHSLKKFVDTTRGRISSMSAIDLKHQELGRRWEKLVKESGL